jgi:carboxymethylenebutenolidase
MEVAMRKLAFILATLILATSAFAQMGVKDLVKRQLGGEAERQKQLEDAMGNKPQQQQPPQQANPAAIKEGWITRKSKDGKTDTRLFFAYPEAMSKEHPVAALVVIQEWWGLNDDIQDRTRDFARHGFYAVAPDLYHGQVTDDPQKAAELKKKLTDDAAMTDMKTALDLLEEESKNGVVDAHRIASIGWCMGGEQSLLLSLADPRVKATALFYGPLVTDPAKLKNLQGPVLGIFGDDDKNPSPADVEKFRSALKAAGKTDVLILRYTGVGHAFASKAASKIGLYNEAKAKEAWGKTWQWLDQKLARK